MLIAAAATTTSSVPAVPYTSWQWASALGVIAVLAAIALLLLAFFYSNIQKSHFIENLLGVAAPSAAPAAGRGWRLRLSRQPAPSGGDETQVAGRRPPSAASFRFAEEFLARRTEVWLLYAQFIITAVFVGMIGALLLIGAVSVQAGLPALSGVVGIALGKTLLSSRGTPQTTQEPGLQRAPVNITPPTLTPSGTAPTGTTLVADPGEWSGQPPISFAYAWNRRGDSGDNPITGVQQSSYAVQEGDANSRIWVVVTASNAFGTASAPSSPVLIASATS